jgi:hypothetical protein
LAAPLASDHLFYGLCPSSCGKIYNKLIKHYISGTGLVLILRLKVHLVPSHSSLISQTTLILGPGVERSLYSIFRLRIGISTVPEMECFITFYYYCRTRQWMKFHEISD